MPAQTAPPAAAPKPMKKKAPEAEQPEEPIKKKGKKKLIVVAALIVVVVIGGAYGFKTMTKHKAAATTGPTTTVGGPITVEDSLTVNLRDDHYLEFTAAIQTAPGKSIKVLTTDQPIVLDILNTQAEAMTETQLLAPGGDAKLKADIVAAMNDRWPGLVQNVYFNQFVMQ
jgi:flagellar basal body-associated protein FliL